eukprot:6176466-Pleurochrysis_carterae.AAC.1
MAEMHCFCDCEDAAMLECSLQPMAVPPLGIVCAVEHHPQNNVCAVRATRAVMRQVKTAQPP